MEENRKSPAKIALIAIAVLFVTITLIIPLIYVMIRAFGDGMTAYFEAVTEEYTLKALQLTLISAVTALLTNTVFAIFCAWAMTRFEFRGKRILSALIDMPIAVSPVIAGLLFSLTYGRNGYLYQFLHEQFGIKLYIISAVPGVILATIFVTFPYISRELIPVLERIGTQEEEAAALMGAKGTTIFFKITLPHMKWALLYGIILCTARALGEFGAVAVVSGKLRGITNTLPLHIENLYNEFNYTAAFAVSSILVLIALVVLVLRNRAALKMKKIGG